MRYISQVFTINNASTTHTTAVDISSMTAASVQAKFSDGAAAGTLKIQVSNDPPASTGATGASNWSDVTGSSASVASGALTLLPKIDVSYNWLQVVFTSSAGAGTIAVSVKTDGY